VRRKLKAWYDKSARTLPWRDTRDPYRIWISEIMLQQTTVAAVVPYYERFFQRFPTLESLAKSEEDEILKLWEGLGYYSRARNIRKAAIQLWEQLGGAFPRTVSELMELPGIGRYTAGAIVSFAFDQPAPILEANTLRVNSRLIGFADDPASARGQKVLWQFAEDILPRENPGRMNQALMELGATVCTPKNPACSACPVNRECRAFADGAQAEIPFRKEQTPVTNVMEASIAVRRGNAVLLRRRPPGERWAGLWDFPRFELQENEVALSAGGPKGKEKLLEPRLSPAAQNRVEQNIHDLTGIRSAVEQLAIEFHHGVTRFRIHLLCYLGRYVEGQIANDDGIRWVALADLADYPLSVTGRKFADWLSRID
jgi:A/G-specific adenine glycosylase